MEKRANIKFCFKIGKTASETYQLMRNIYADECPSYATILKYHGRYHNDKENQEVIEKVKNILRSDSSGSMRLDEEVSGIRKCLLYRILNENLGKKKVCARFVPHTLSDDQKYVRIQYCLDMKHMADIEQGFIQNIITGDGTWCYQYQISKAEGNTSVKGVQKKSLLYVFFDAEGLIYKEFVPFGESVTAENYLGVMNRLSKKIATERPKYNIQGSWSLLHNNTPAHKSKIVKDFLARKGIVELEQPLYSPDLAPCDFWLFPKLKAAVTGKQFETINDMQNNWSEILDTIPKIDYENCFKDFYKRFQRCIDKQGGYLK